MITNIFIWDMLEESDEWISCNLRKNRVHILGYLSENEEDLLPLIQDTTYDYILIFEKHCKDIIDGIFKTLSIPSMKIIYVLDKQSLWEHRDIAYYILNENCKPLRMIENYQNSLHKDFVCCTAENISYVGFASDEAIMPRMDITNQNWAKDEMHMFYQLTQKYYPSTSSSGYFCDIGANIGTTSIYFKKNLDPNVHILAFEPVPATHRLLHANMLLNDIPENAYTIECLGLSDTNTTQNISFDPKNPGGSTYSADLYGNLEETQLTTFDEYVKTHNISPNDIRYIWMDTEGFETNVLLGAKETLSTYCIPLFMEFTPYLLKKAGNFNILIDTLSSLYKKYIIIQDALHTKPDKEVVHDIDELSSFASVDNDLQFDIFLIK